ncbi:MAG TPA: GDSL-type esterase/lipase family protein [Thermoanaerobaculia bacterium]|nr:GDSL-type esterase/lipase family protein [Thermoanaerobaculia bacterium]
MSVDVTIDDERAEHGLGRRDWGRAGRLALLAGASLLLGLLVSELALRIAGFSYHLRPEKVELGWPPSLAALGNEYRADSDLLWTRVEYQETLAHARVERPVFAFLGDSCTEYGGYPEGMLADLAARRPDARWTGVNLGTAGWSTYQGLRQLRRDVLPLRPRVITIYFGWNDHWIGFGLPDDEVAKLLHRTGSGWQDVRLVQLAEKADVATHRSANNRRVPLPEFRQNLDAMVRLAKSHGIEPVLLTAPSSHVAGREPQELRGRWLSRLEELVPLHQSYVAAVRDVAREDGAALCDLARDFETLPGEQRRRSFLKDGIHFTRRGAKRAADFLADCLSSSGVLDRAAAAR